ncbi:hypothetical protein [Mycobacteroides immunogenum]|uniref:hypothetical protein n=1 Tax=Mycobacteroides immunogenum TaxID=83262 RepID=UPI000697A1D5|nr:hypothetical protein [Mycobacteroides immunogenum]ORV78880.1 hypothetical protein AWC10_09775 [Mycobacteroides immunogenum]
MSLSLADIKRAKVQAFRDVADGLDAMASANRDMKRGVEQLPIMGDGWKGVSGDAAHHEIDAHGKYLEGHAQAQQGAAAKIRRAADEFEGVQQLLKKIENDATSGKFTINYDTGEVTPPNGKYDKNELDYLTNTLRQIRAAGEAANTDLEAAVKAAQSLPDPSGAAAQALPLAPGSAIKPNGQLGALQNVAGLNPDGDPGATKAAAATGVDTEAKYKEWYPKNTVPVGDKSVDPSKLGGVGALPGVGNIDKTAPAKLAPTLADRDVPAFKDITRQNLINAKVPADQIEQRVNDAVKAAQAPRFMTEAEQMRTPGQVPLHNSAGDQFNDIIGRANDSATKTVGGQIEQGKILTGQAGPGAPGVADTWKDVGLGAAKQVHELMTDPLAAPKMGIQEAQDFYNHPGESIGKNIILGTEGLASGAIGGEAAAGARGLLGDLTGAEGRALTHDLSGPPVDTPGGATHPGPLVDHPGSAVDHTVHGDHPTPHAPTVDGWSGHSALDSSGQLSAEVRDHVLSLEKGSRPDPSDYLPREYIDHHLSQFSDGASRFMPESNLDKYGIAQRDGTSFVMPKGEADSLIGSTQGNPRLMEKALGLPDGYLDSNKLVRVDVPDPGKYELRMPSGNEAGANEQWIPGGKLPDGASEAIIDGGRIPSGGYNVTEIPNGGGHQ